MYGETDMSSGRTSPQSKSAHRSGSIYCRERQKRRFRVKRNALIFLWSLIFAYYSVVNADVPTVTEEPLEEVIEKGKSISNFS